MFDLLVFNLSDSPENLRFPNAITHSSPSVVNENIFQNDRKEFAIYPLKNENITNYKINLESSKELLFNPTVLAENRAKTTYFSQVAQDLAPNNDEANMKDNREKQWQFEVTPYGFVPVKIQGNSIINGVVTPDVDVDLGELLELLDFAAAVRLEAWKNNKFGLIFDGYYADLGDEQTTIIETGGDTPQVELTGDLDFKQGIFDFGVGYRTAINVKDDNTSNDYFDIIGGIRVQYLEQTLDVDAVTIDGSVRGSRKFGGDSTWVEPFVSSRLNVGFTENLNFNGRFDISGFAIDDLSLTWRFLGGIEWSVRENISLNLGYSLFSIDYETGSGNNKQGIDSFQHGPLIGLTFKF